MLSTTLHVSAFLCLALFSSESEQVYTQTRNSVSHDGLWITQDNSYMEKIKRDFQASDSAQWYEQINFLQDITEESSILLDYRIQRQDSSAWSSWWTDVGTGSVNICFEDTSTQDGTIVELVRTILAMPVGCPVTKGLKDLSYLHFNLENELLMYNEDLASKHIQIEVNVHDNAEPKREILKGYLDIIPPGQDSYYG